MTINKKRLKNICFLIISIILSLIILIIGGEIICRVNYTIKQKTLISAHKSIDYNDIWSGTLGPGGYLKPNFNNFVTGAYGNTVRWKNNSQGFRYNRDIGYTHDKAIIRILSLGDSFTGGYRLEQKQTFSYWLEKYFNHKNNGKKFEVIPTVINEPYAGLIYLSNIGIKFNPNVVILGITLVNDIMHNYITSTNNNCYVFDKETETIKDNDCLQEALDKITLTPIFIPTECQVKKNEIKNRAEINNNNINILNYSMLYKIISSFFKKYTGEPIISCNNCNGCKQNIPIFDLCNGLDIFLKNPPIDELPSMLKTLYKYNQLSKQYNFKLIIIIFPQRYQVQKEDWKATVEKYGLNEDGFDLMKPNNLILSFCKKEGVNCIDPTLNMSAFYNKERKSLYFPLGDMHWNALGNKVLYEIIKEEIYRIINENS